MRVAYYAVGGGLGHLVRARAFLHTLSLTREAVVVTTSPFAHDARVAGGTSMRIVPSALEHDVDALRAWLRDDLVRLAPDVFCTDAFPGGILGELCGLALPRDVESWHVARLLNWPRYAALLGGPTPRYARCWRVEPLAAAHEEYLRGCCGRIEDLELVDPPEVAEAAAIATEPYWLVAHSGPPAEVAELVAYADEMRAIEQRDVPLWIASPQPPLLPPAGCRIVDAFPLGPLYRGAERILTAAGFNTLRQTRLWRDRQVVLPMPRRFDDQYERARRAFAGLQRDAARGGTRRAGDPVTGDRALT